jgi:hypothetical protein
MDSPMFSQFIADAANIKASGRWAAMNEKIGCLAKNPGVDNEWQAQLLGAFSALENCVPFVQGIVKS